MDNPSDEYFQFEVTKDELTGDIGLLITDFVDEDEVEEMNLLWESQVTDLKHALGLAWLVTVTSYLNFSNICSPTWCALCFIESGIVIFS